MSNELAKQISYILYSSPEEDVKVMALVKDETIWLTQKAMAELFDCSTDNISLHLKNVFAGISSESPGLPDLIREQEGYPVFPVHRLDQTTGGVCVLARSSTVCAKMQQLFQQDQVIKEYLAVISGAPDSDSGLFC